MPRADVAEFGFGSDANDGTEERAQATVNSDACACSFLSRDVADEKARQKEKGEPRQLSVLDTVRKRTPSEAARCVRLRFRVGVVEGCVVEFTQWRVKWLKGSAGRAAFGKNTCAARYIYNAALPLVEGGCPCKRGIPSGRSQACGGLSIGSAYMARNWGSRDPPRGTAGSNRAAVAKARFVSHVLAPKCHCAT